MKLTLHSPLKDLFITQQFGELNPLYTGVTTNGRHNGLDMRAPDGTHVYASHDGRVTFAGYDGGGGLGIVIRTNEEVEFLDGSISFGKSLYWHLKKDSLLVTGGQQVVKGQHIADADNTGLSTGSHLHFGLKPISKGENDWTWYNTEQSNGYMGAVDPVPYLVDKFIPFKDEMKYREKSNNVAVMQAFFIRLGLMTAIDPEDFGLYGPRTASAVYDFMKNSKTLSMWERLNWRGKNVGQKTLSELNKRYK